MLRESNSDSFRQLLKHYSYLLEVSIEVELCHGDNTIKGPLRELAATPEFPGATPLDVVELYTKAVKAGMGGVRNWPVRAPVEVGRMVILQVMGYFVTHYRNRGFREKNDGDLNCIEMEKKDE